MGAVASAARMIAARGESMTLTRTGEGTTITLKGKRIPGSLVDGGNSSTQQVFRVKIGTAELLASAWSVKVPNASGDRLTVGGTVRTILDVKPLIDAGVTALYELEVAGAA